MLILMAGIGIKYKIIMGNGNIYIMIKYILKKSWIK